MQNWNPWQTSAGVNPTPPGGYTADPMALMQSYMQYYNQPTPTGYTAEQWAAAQQQGWAQWQQWQQQYQQWQTQYGDKYQETMKHLSTQNVNLASQTQLPVHMQHPPLPKDDVKPPLPPTTNTCQFPNMPPPHQNNLPLFPAKESVNKTVSQTILPNYPQNPPLPTTSQPPLPPEIGESRENTSMEKRDSNTVSELDSAKKLKFEEDELSQAEKTFDAQFKQWEEQFNTWKQQNVNHPDKTQYKQYEAKWTSWREKLIERREQMRKKREQQKQAAAAKAEIEKNNTSGDNKILNILSNTENQRLVNNLLGIGKTLGLTGKQNTIAPLPPPPPPPPPPETTNSNNQTAGITQGMQQALMQVNMMRSNATSSWSNQQWGMQYNSTMQTPGYSNVQAMPLASFGHVPSQMMPSNFAQPPPSLLNVIPNFSQPPPNFHSNDSSQSQNVRAPGPACNMQDKPSFGSFVQPTADMRFMHPNDRSAHNFDEQSNFRKGEQERFGRENSNLKLNEQQKQFRSTDALGMRNDSYNDRMPEAQSFRKDDRNDFGDNQLNAQNNFNSSNDRLGLGGRADTDRFSGGSNRLGSMGNERLMSGNDQFAPTNDRFGPGSERFGLDSDRFRSVMDRPGIDKGRLGAGNDRFGLGNDRFGVGNDRFGVGNARVGPDNDRFGPGIDRFGPGNDRFGLANDRFGSNDRFPVSSTDRTGLGTDSKDRFPSDNDRFTLNNEHFGRSDRFGRDCFEFKDSADHRRDNFGNNSRSFNRDNQFSPPNELSPELKKLMEKRKAAVDVFKPSFLDSEKTSTVGSLSESFKKITGESLFKSSFDLGQKNVSLHGSGNFPNSGLISNFQPHSFSDIGHASSSTYSLRNLSFNIRDNESSTFRGQQENFIKDSHNPNAEYGKKLEKDLESRQSHQSQLVNMQIETPIKNVVSTVDASQKNNIEDVKNEIKSTQANELENNIIQKDFSISEEGLSKKGNNKDENKLDNNDSLQQDGKDRDIDQMQSNNEKKDDSNNDNSKLFKKSESLPFMGDNDPPPEDLNIEPPPELPNLASISTDTAINNESFNPNRTSDEKFDGKTLVASQFDVQIGPKKTEFKSNVTFGPRNSTGFGPTDSMFPVVSGSNVSQLQAPTDIRLLPQGSNDAQFGPDGPFDERFNLKRASDENYDARNRNDEQIGGIRGVNQTGQLGSQDSMNERFGSRSFNDNKFVPGGSIDRQMGPPFALKNSGPFEARNNDMQFAPRVPTGRFDSRVLPEGGPKVSPDGPRGLRGPNDIPLGIQRSTEASFRNEAPFDKRPFDNSGSCGFPGDRRVSEGPSGSRIFNDSTLSSRAPSDMFLPKDNMFGSRAVNDNRYNDTHFGPSNSFVTKRSIDDSNNPAWGVGDGNSFRNRDYMHKDSYLRKEQFEDNSPAKIGRFDSSKPEEFNKSYFDRSIEMNMRKDNANDGRRIPYDPYKKDLDENVSRSGYGINDTWKQNRFSNVDQRPDDNQRNIDKNMPATFDERLRLERNMIESKIGDYKSGYVESSTGSDFQSKYGSNLFMKRPLDGRQFPLRGNQEFCVQRQFNYNHGEIDKKYVEHVPAKVIDYAHMSRSSIMDRLSPVQCFDYGHGDLKPVVPDCEQQPKKDFRNWVENEQNLKEYTEKMKNYEKYATDYDIQRPKDHNKRKDSNWLLNNKKFDRDKKEKEDYKERIHNTEERDFGNDQNNRYQSDKNTYKERTHEICDNSRREMNKDNDKHDNRSKGNINWQENSNKNIVDTKSQDSSLPDTKKNVVESTSKILELAKMPNYTMVDDLLCPPGRQNRPPKITIILRGPPGSGKSFVAKLIKDKEVEQGGSAPRILSLDDYFLVEKEIETKDDNEKKITVKEMVYEYEEAMEQSYIASLVKAFKKNIIDGFFNFIILDCINEKISDYEEMWSFAKTKGFKVYVCEMEMDLQICLKRNIHNRTEDEINHIIDYFEPTPSYHHKLDVNSMLQEQAIEEVDMEDSQEVQEEKPIAQNEDSQDSWEDIHEKIGVSKWEKMEAEDKLNRLDGLAKKKSEGKPQTMEDFLQVPDYYNMEDTSGKKRVRWADLEERKEQEKMRAVGFVVGHTNWDRMMDPTKGGSALTRTKYI